MNECHTRYRKNHNSQPLAINEKLTREAHQYARYLVKNGIFEHDKNNTRNGENLFEFFSYGSDVDSVLYEVFNNSLDAACKGWYCEIKDYNYKEEHRTGNSILHFTQLVWKSSKLVGYGLAAFVDDSVPENSKLKFVVVARYYPAETVSNRLLHLSQNQIKMFEQAMHKCHNNYRRDHGSAPLTFDETLNAESRRYAEYLASNDLFDHETGDNAKQKGENLYRYRTVSSDTDYSLKYFFDNQLDKACQSWYCEITEYNYKLEHSTPANVLHFTQLIWKGSRTVGYGLAIVISDNNYSGYPRITFVVVTKYYPRGNIIGFFKDNVVKRKGRIPKECSKSKIINEQFSDKQMDVFQCLRPLFIVLLPSVLVRITSYALHFNINWFENLKKPAIMDLKFTMIFIDIAVFCMGVSGFLIDQHGSTPWMRILYISTLIACMMSNLTFCLMHDIYKAFTLRVMATILSAMCMISFYAVDTTAALLVLPLMVGMLTSTSALYCCYKMNGGQTGGSSTGTRRKSRE
ncbi:hypothetical protein GJ496_002865 [Pomphorhynchus laevis]|nr:hypothetical protein GJ496_002865 [Pomphorhynchus laevis]